MISPLSKHVTDGFVGELGRLLARHANRVWNYLHARYRRFRTPKELRDADFYLWIENLNKCRDCYFLDPNNGRPTCDVCGCFVETKARWMSESCPLGEWDNTVHLRQRIQDLANPYQSKKQSHQPPHQPSEQ